jgi:ABC-type sugar transport system ATPase subunit
MTMLSVDVQKKLGDFSLAARFEAQGGVTALFGPSGSGKTTLVNMIAGLVRPDRGRIALDDTVLFDSTARIHVPAHRRRIGYVFQEGRLFPHMTVARNLDYGRRMSGLAADEAETGRCCNAARGNFPAANASASLSAARCSCALACCSSTSPWRRLTANARRRSCLTSSACAMRPRCRWSMSATTPRKCAALRAPLFGWRMEA